MSQAKAKPTFRPLVVLDFLCDACHKKIDSVVIMQARGVKLISKSYHEACWKREVLPHTRLGAT